MSGQSAENDAPVLVRMPVESIVTNWRVGSAEWSWDEERADLANDPVTAAVRHRGHHRIVIALEQGITHLNAECPTSPEASAP